MKALRAILFVSALLALFALVVWLSSRNVSAQSVQIPGCFTLSFEYRAGEFTNVESFTVERTTDTNIVFTSPDEMVRIYVRLCDVTNAFLRVGASPPEFPVRKAQGRRIEAGVFR